MQGPPPGAPKSNKTGLIVLVAVLGVAVLAGGAFFLIGPDDDEDNTPKGAVEAFFKASKDKNCGAQVDLTTDESWPWLFTSWDGSSDPPGLSRTKAVGSCEEQADSGQGVDTDKLLSAKLKSEDGDQATVEVRTENEDGEKSNDEVPLMKVDGKWRIDFATFFEDILGEPGDQEGASGRPEDVASAYFDAFAAEDCETMTSLVTQESLGSGEVSLDDAISTCEDSFAAEGVSDFLVEQIEVVDENDDTAVLSVSATVDGEPDTKQVTMRKEDGVWKIDLDSFEGTTSTSTP